MELIKKKKAQQRVVKGCSYVAILFKQIYFLQFVIQKFGYAWRTMRTISPEDDLNDLKLAKCYMLLLNPCPSLSFQQSV